MELRKNEIGTYTISEKAFKDIAAIACSNVKDVYPVKKDNEYVECKLNKSGDPVFTLSVRVKQGVDIVSLCKKIQSEVNETVLLMTGIDCKNIDIDIQGFELAK